MLLLDTNLLDLFPYKAGFVAHVAGVFVILTAAAAHRYCQQFRASTKLGKGIARLNRDYPKHDVVVAYLTLINEDGAGSWPPRTDYVQSSWPLALRPYHDIYHKMSPFLSASEDFLDDERNNKRRHQYRQLMRELLAESIDLRQVEELMIAAEAGRSEIFPQDVCNAFYCCIAVLRHAYR